MHPDDIVLGFERCTLPPERFGHREHLLVAWTYLRRSSLADAAARFSTHLRRFAEAHGASGKVHETMTWAWLAIVAERMHGADDVTFDAFLARNPDLLDARGALARHYDEATLASARARAVFVLPRRSGT